MELGYTFFYIEANVVCMIIFVMMLVREMGSVGRQAKQMIFVNIAISHMLYFISDITWVLVLTAVIPATHFTVAAVNTSNAILLSAITGFWFVYVELAQGEQYITAFRNRIIALIPAMVETAVIIVMFIFFPDTLIDGNNELRYLYYIIFLAVPALYVSVSAVRSFVRAFRKENYAVRAQYLACAVYPVIITVFGVLQTLWIAAPLFCFGDTIMMLYVYIISLNNQVSVDELTRLNNRTQLKKYITNESFRQGSDKTVRFILMIDLNKFKYINDQFGHVEGDKALKRTAEALKTACSDHSMKTFIARYGGDEFIVVAKTDNEEKVRELCRNIKDTLVRMNRDDNAGYELTASIGYSSYNGDITDFQQALAKADEALYREKAVMAAAARQN